jgi:hypothetical protein
MGSERSPKLVDTFLRLCPRMIVAEFDICVNAMEKAIYNEVGQFSDKAQLLTGGCEPYPLISHKEYNLVSLLVSLLQPISEFKYDIAETLMYTCNELEL